MRQRRINEKPTVTSLPDHFSPCLDILLFRHRPPLYGVRRMKRCFPQVLLLVFGIVSGLPWACHAHTTGLSTSDLRFGTNGLDGEIVMTGVDLSLALAHFEASTPLDSNHDGKLSPEEFAAGLERLRKFAGDFLVVEFDGQIVPSGRARFALDEKDNFRMELNYPGQRPTQLRVRAAGFAHLPPDHLHFVGVYGTDGTALGNKMLKPSDDLLRITLPSGTAKTEPRVSKFTGFFKLGVEHIWTGYDHLLFLLALLLVCKDFLSAVQVVSFFTLAHSITLAFATLNLVSVSSRVTEPAIAASIIYVGVENFARKEGPKGRWLITFLFGLIHGFGFATVLRDMGVASSTTGVAVPLVAFNLGVEAGQIVIAGVLLPVIWNIRKWKPFLHWGVPVTSALVAIVGGFWFIQRVFFA